MTEVAVVDTNVPVTANGSTSVSPDCVRACVAAIVDLTSDRRRLAVDTGWRIISEYRNNLRSSGQPGVGDGFLKWVLTNQANPRRCDLIDIHPLAEEGGFEEFPQRADLATFDPSDRKFVAVANAHPAKPPILQGVDSKWWRWRQGLRAAGISVEFLCEADVRAWDEAKFGTPGT